MLNERLLSVAFSVMEPANHGNYSVKVCFPSVRFIKLTRFMRYNFFNLVNNYIRLRYKYRTVKLDRSTFLGWANFNLARFVLSAHLLDHILIYCLLLFKQSASFLFSMSEDEYNLYSEVLQVGIRWIIAKGSIVTVWYLSMWYLVVVETWTFDYHSLNITNLMCYLRIIVFVN